MNIFIERTKTKKKVKYKGKVQGLLKLLVINPGTVLVTKDNVLLTEEDILKDTDTVKILSVISGG